MSDQSVTPPTDDFDDDFAAAELALGLAEGEDLRLGQDRVRRDPFFAERVAGWHERFVAMTDAIKPVKPPKRVRKAVLAQIFPKVRVPLMQRLWVWQGISLAAILMVAYLAMPLLRPVAPEGAGPIYATQLTGDVDELQVFAILDPARGGIALRRVAGAPPEGRVLELWAILPGDDPVSLGVVPEEPNHLPLPPEFAERINDLTLAISDEPPGGSTTGAPSGEVRALGAVSEI